MQRSAGVEGLGPVFFLRSSGGFGVQGRRSDPRRSDCHDYRELHFLLHEP